MTFALRELLAQERYGVLATLSSRKQGWPFASIAAYALTDDSEPLLLLSDLAEHTRNLQVDSRTSLLVQDSAALQDPQAGSRLTLLGIAELVSGGEAQRNARGRYVERHPQASQYLSMADFRLYVLRVTEARFISGFGDMGWIDATRFRRAMAAEDVEVAR